MEGDHRAEEFTREQLMVRANFDRKAWAALIKVYEIEMTGGSPLIRYCRCCGWMVTEGKYRLPHAVEKTNKGA